MRGLVYNMHIRFLTNQREKKKKTSGQMKSPFTHFSTQELKPTPTFRPRSPDPSHTHHPDSVHHPDFFDFPSHSYAAEVAAATRP
jgi:hypothetical protein